jgi:hypothetical protein
LPQGDQIEQLFPIGPFFPQEKKKSPKCLATFFNGKISVLILTKEMGLGNILGGFFYKLIRSLCTLAT